MHNGAWYGDWYEPWCMNAAGTDSTGGRSDPSSPPCDLCGERTCYCDYCCESCPAPSCEAPSSQPPAPPPPPPLDQTGLIVGISSGAVALVLLFVGAIVIVFCRTSPARAAAKARRTLATIGLIPHLNQAGVGGDGQVLERAAAWVTANKPASVEDLIRFGMVQGFVDSLSLPAIPRQKLLAELGGHEATPVAMGMAVDEQKELGGVRLSGSAGAAASSSTQPTLIQAAEILKRDLRLEGSVKNVVQQAAAQLGIEPGPPLTELAQQCLRELQPGMTQEV